MRTMQFGIRNRKDVELVAIEFDTGTILYVVEDKQGVRGCSRKNWKMALKRYDINKNKKNLK